MKKSNTKTSHTRKKYLLLLALSLGFSLLLVACTNGTDPTDPGTTENGAEERFTLEELAEFDGQDGGRAYIAIDGVVYDVTDVPEWSGGMHAGDRFIAGKDYSNEIRDVSPHGVSVLSRAERVGILVTE